jgi:hypothetical protein
MKTFNTAVLLFGIGISSACAQIKPGSELFWTKLGAHCGKAFEGIITEGADNPAFKDKKLIMHVRSCDNTMIRIPFFVGDDRSRTWILKYENERILLKHDHRHEDGSEDKITQYGGWTTNAGLPDIQVFPADALTAIMIPQAATNVWWITLNDSYFTYNLKRIGSDRLFTVKFDLSKPVSGNLSPPWGWKD